MSAVAPSRCVWSPSAGLRVGDPLTLRCRQRARPVVASAPRVFPLNSAAAGVTTVAPAQQYLQGLRRPRPCSQAVGRVTVRSTKATAAGSSVEPLPSDPVEMMKQAAAAVKRGVEDGKMRHRLDLLLPINEKEFDFGATEAMDYPCSIQKEYDTAISLVKLMVEQLLGSGTKVTVQRIDDGGVEGEPCGVVKDSGNKFAAVVYPTSDKLKQMRALAENDKRILLIVNPQWRESGQIVSDFGFGPWKKAAYDFLDTFESSYSLIERRVGAPGSVSAATGSRFTTGGVLRTLRCYPGQYEVFAMAVDGSNQLLGTFDDMPTYKESEDIIQKGRDAKLEIFTRAIEVSKLQDEGKASAEGVAVAQVEIDPSMPLTEATVETMDAVQVRKALSARGLPTSGKLAVLRKRLKEAAVEA